MNSKTQSCFLLCFLFLIGVDIIYTMTDLDGKRGIYIYI